MRLIKKTGAVFLAGLLMCSAVTAASAARTGSALEFTARENAATKITYTDGAEKIYSGILNPESIEQSSAASNISSYELTLDGESVLEVSLTDIRAADDEIADGGYRTANGYYAVSFELTGQNKEAFITGLNPSNLGKVQRALVKSYEKGTELMIEDFDFIDAEKTEFDNLDDNLCWAAACSNMLAYSGWGQYAGFADTYDIFDDYVKNFYDGGFNIGGGLLWFFNGASGGEDYASAKNKNYGESGNYIPNVSFDSIGNTFGFDADPAAMLRNLTQSLRGGNAVGLGVYWGAKDNYITGGHAITCWGYVLDNNYPENDTRHYDALIISDSDSDELPDQNRRTSPNILNVISMIPYRNDRINYNGVIFENYFDGILSSFTYLSPYGDEACFETETLATLDKINTVDINCDIPKFSTSPGLLADGNIMPQGADVYVHPYLNVTGDVPYSGELEIEVSVEDSAGKIIALESRTENFNMECYEDIFSKYPLKLSGLAEGKYTARVSVNMSRSLREAFYTNNTRSCDFEVRKAEFDFSEWSLEAVIPSCDSFYTPAELSYNGVPESYFEDEGYGYVVAEYYVGGEWVQAENKVGYVSRGELPRSAKLEKRGSKVRFSLILNVPDVDTVILTSEEYPINYNKIEIIPSESCTTEFTPLENGTCSFADGEQIAFTVRNLSPRETFEGSVTVTAYCNVNDELITLIDKPVSIEAGGTGEEFIISDWKEFPWIQGTFVLSALAEGSCGDEPYVIATNEFGEVKIKETDDTRVAHAELTYDPFDGVTTFGEAVKNCPDGGTVTFDDGIRQIYAPLTDLYGFTGDVEEIVIDKDITIDGTYLCDNGSTCGVKLGGIAFKIEKGANVTLRGLNIDNAMYIPRENGGMIYSLGNLTVDRCMFEAGKADLAGGELYINGGSAKISNSTFSFGSALYGGALAVNGGAKVDMLNCSVINGTSRTGMVQNINGELNIVNSDFTGGGTNGGYESNSCAVTGNRATRIVNSVFINNLDDDRYDVSGEAELYGCAYGKLADGVYSDDGCVILTGSINIIDISQPQIDIAGMYSSDVPLGSVTNILPEYRSQGYITAVSGGEIVYSDGENTYKTGVPAAFDEDTYAYDIIEKERVRAFGCCCDVSVIPKQAIAGDINGDGAVDVLDAVMAQKYAVELIELDNMQISAGDVNCDGVVDALDAAMIQQYSVGKIEEFYIWW